MKTMAVKFIDHTPLHIAHLCSGTKGAKYNDEHIQRQVFENVLRRKQFTEYNLLASKVRWIKAQKPFFNLFPQVSKAIQKTSLNVIPSKIPESIVNRLGCVCVRLSMCSDIVKKYGVGWFFIDFCKGKKISEDSSSGHIFDAFAISYQTADNVFCFSTRLDVNFIEAEEWLTKDNETESEAEVRKLLAQISLGVLFLAADPDYIKPVLLKADEGKSTPIEERIARAKNRGVYGFTIGEEIERCPHFRRPHFAIRWTGKGAEIPKLVPVKGAIVGKEKMTTVPTGYEEQSDE
jgi:hypothetical protein